jgi:hypothetical protein
LEYYRGSALAFTSSSKRQALSIAARSAAEAGILALVVAGGARVVLNGPGEAASVARGAAAAWLASTVGAGWMILAREASVRAFWWAFGGGFFLRLAGLAGLAVYASRTPWIWPAGLLVTYALGVLFMLLIEYRHIKLK